MDNNNQSNEQLLDVSAEYVVWNINVKEALLYIPSGVFVVVLLILGIPGNGLVIYVYSFHFKPSTVNLLIKVLAILDAICCIFGMTFEIVDLFFPVLNGESYSCKLFRTIEQMGEFSSGEILLLIAYDRYLHVCKPFRVFSHQKARRLVYTSVAIGLLVSIPTFIVMGKSSEVIHGIKVHGCNRKTDTFTFIYYLSINCVLGLSFMVIVLQYICIWSTIYKWKHTNVGQTASIFKHGSPARNTVKKDTGQTIRQNYISNIDMQLPKVARTIRQPGMLNLEGSRTQLTIRQRKIVKPVIILCGVTFVFAISYVPYFILIMLENTGSVDVTHLPFRYRQIWELAYKTYFLNNVLNPIVYGILDHRFRQKCFDVLFRPRYFERVCC